MYVPSFFVVLVSTFCSRVLARMSILEGKREHVFNTVNDLISGLAQLFQLVAELGHNSMISRESFVLDCIPIRNCFLIA